MSAEESKIAVYSLPDLKNTTDDALPNYLTSIGFSQSQLLSNLRLGLQAAMVIIAAGAFLLDYTKEWSETKDITFWAVGVYFLLSVLVTGLVWLVENGMVFHGSYGGQTLNLRTRVERHDPTYYITFSTTSTSSRSTVSVPFSTFFTSDGRFVAAPFQTWLAGNVPLVGTADPARAKLASQPTNASERVADAVEEDAAAAGSSGTPTKRKIGRR